MHLSGSYYEQKFFNQRTNQLHLYNFLDFYLLWPSFRLFHASVPYQMLMFLILFLLLSSW